MRNINFTPAMYKAVVFMTCMMLLMVVIKSKAAVKDNQQVTNQIFVKTK
jgi:hypothetical protein